MNSVWKWILGVLSFLTVAGGGAWATSIDSRLKQLEDRQISAQAFDMLVNDVRYIRRRIDKMAPANETE